MGTNKKKQSMKQRCSFCRKKLGMITFSCNCGGIFCVAHQTAHSHNCQCNQKSSEKQKIETNNPSIIHTKVTKI
jgi:AN1-type zinc finger protein 5/6